MGEVAEHEDDGAEDGPIVLPEGAACGTCYYSRLVQVAPNVIQRARVCKRMPPTPVLVPMPGQDGRPVLNITAQSPVVQDKDVCYEWDLAEVALIPTGLG